MSVFVLLGNSIRMCYAVTQVIELLWSHLNKTALFMVRLISFTSRIFITMIINSIKARCSVKSQVLKLLIAMLRVGYYDIIKYPYFVSIQFVTK